jgi:hypothetical protein
MKSNSVALVLVSHENAAAVARMTHIWNSLTTPGQCLVAYGGERSEFDKIAGDKVFVNDPRLRTSDHQREFQSYSKLLATALDTLADKNWEWLFIAEYDLVPIKSDLFPEIIAEAEREEADLLGAGASRLDNTLHSHHGVHAAAAGWSAWVKSISRRENPKIVLSCLGSAQLWRREAIEAVVAVGEPIETYLEILLPTVAHHLGFRVRPWKSHANFIQPDPLPCDNLDVLKAKGALLAHPIKGYWTRSSR